MTAIAQTTALATSGVSLLAYLQRMADTARTDAVRRIFDSYVELEKWRLGLIAPVRGGPVVRMPAEAGQTTTAPAEREERTGGNGMRNPKQSATQAQAKKNGVKLFTFQADPDVKQVCLAGDFNGWDPAALSMRKRAGMFVKRVELQPGEHHYKFLVDGQWMTDPEADAQAPNEFGSMNSVVRV
jgi:hypothetical protein